jgi:uncharacterized membrane-anchored protein
LRARIPAASSGTGGQALSIHRIDTRRREFFYLASGIVFAGAIAVPAIAHRRFGLAAVPAFWIAYVITRPLGASFADRMGVSHARRGLGWGTGPVTLGWLAAIVALVGCLLVPAPTSHPATPDFSSPSASSGDSAGARPALRVPAGPTRGRPR